MRINIIINDKITVSKKQSEKININLKIEEYIGVVLKKEGSV